MNRMKTLTAAAVTFGLMSSGAAFAQNVNANNLVNVNISNVANEIAKNLDVNVEDIQALASVQVPIGVAATVCDIQANVLADQNKDGDATCTAGSTSQALNQAVQRQM